LKSLVEYGLAQFKNKGDTDNSLMPVVIKEPLALVSIMRYLESQGHTLVQHIQTDLNGAGRWAGFEKLVLVVITKLLRDGNSPLTDIFQFHGETPEWAREKAQIVVQTSSDDYKPFDIIDDESVLHSIGFACEAEGPEDVQRWLQHGGAGWCIPGNKMGPDLMAWVRLPSSGRILLLVIQAKCRLSGTNTSTSADITADAIGSLTPGEFFRSSVCKLFSRSSLASLSCIQTTSNMYEETQQGKEEQIQAMLTAINKTDRFTAGEYNILRVVAAFPLVE
jgi:hypothetical protein